MARQWIDWSEIDLNLVIGVGNTLRRDDGLGPFIATSLPPIPGVITLAVHQLTAELTEQLSGVDRVLFIDASMTDEQIKLKRITERNVPPGHVFAPAALLALARAIHGTAPEGWLLPVPGSDFDFGEQLSSQAAAIVPTARKVVLDWIHEGEELCSYPTIDNVE